MCMYLGSGWAANTLAEAVHQGKRYELIAHWSRSELNHILGSTFPAFSGVSVDYGRPTNGVRLYRVFYSSVIPEHGNLPIQATGLVAVPDTQTQSYPVVSYQHGTVYGKNEVPSQPENSPETQLMLALFAGHGYVVMAADYFGMGQSSWPEGYLVKASHQQATYDMLQAGKEVLHQMQLVAGPLFLAGWSQGGFVTMALLEKLEKSGVDVAATATASAPLDLGAMLAGYLLYPRPNDASWVNSVIILSAFAFEHYYQVPGLARSVFKDEHYDVARRAYLREPFDPKDLPTNLRQLIRPEYFQPLYLSQSTYGRLMADTVAYRWLYQTPVRNYFGEADEAITPGIGQLAATYQHAVGAGNIQVTAISTGPTSHRGTYAVAAKEWKKWFDALAKVSHDRP